MTELYRYDIEYGEKAFTDEQGAVEDAQIKSEAQRIGGIIYMRALSGRRGFRDDQMGIDDVEIWKEIFEHIGETALAILAALPSDGWRDIESAPRDGTAFMAYWPDHENDGGQWGAEQATTWVTPDGRFLSNSGVLDDFFPEDWLPTHWRPLPQPPAQSEGGVDAD